MLSNGPELVGKYRPATQWKVYTRRNKVGSRVEREKLVGEVDKGPM